MLPYACAALHSSAFALVSLNSPYRVLGCQKTAAEFRKANRHTFSHRFLLFQFRIYRVFLKILTHLFSFFEVLNVCQSPYSVHETKERSLEICLTACMLSFVRSYNRTKEKAKTLQFHFWAKSSILTQRRFRDRFRHETVSSRNTIICLTEKYTRGRCVSIPQKSFSGRKKQVRTAEKARLIRTLV